MDKQKQDHKEHLNLKWISKRELFHLIHQKL